MTALFVSDIHLSQERPDIVERFIAFLDFEARAASALYILGDLFDLWLGDDDGREPHPRIVAALRRYRDAGPLLLVMHGNHDFLLGSRFERETGCRLLPEPCRIEVPGTSRAGPAWRPPLHARRGLPGIPPHGARPRSPGGVSPPPSADAPRPRGGTSPPIPRGHSPQARRHHGRHAGGGDRHDAGGRRAMHDPTATRTARRCTRSSGMGFPRPGSSSGTGTSRAACSCGTSRDSATSPSTSASRSAADAQGSAAQAPIGAARGPFAPLRAAPSYPPKRSRSSRLTTFPMLLFGSSSAKTTLLGRL